MQSFFSIAFGLFFTALLLGICWVVFIKPFLLLPVKTVKGALDKTFLVGVSVGNKLADMKVVKKVEPEGEVVAEVAVMDQFEVPGYEVAKWVNSHAIKKQGYILFRGYANHVERCFVVEGNAIFAKKHGKRIKLSPLEGKFERTDESLIKQSVQDVAKLFEANVSKLESKKVIATEVAKSTVRVKEPIAVQAAVPKPDIPSASKGKALETYKGFLISYGKATRYISSSKDDGNGEESGREIEQFRVVIRSEDGVEESIWGQDLFRAIKDANILINDMVEVIKLGKRQFGKSWKNLYEVNKLA